MAEFSRVKIKFLIDFEIGYKAKLSTTLNDVFTPQTWEWVNTRSAGFEVTTGTPTATAGERTAINFAAAFNLDNPDDYIVNVDINEVEIISETEGLDFVGFKVDDELGRPVLAGSGYIVVFENYVAPIDLTTIDFALVKSPHYINIPFLFDTTISASVDVFVWYGDVVDVPALPTYSLTIPRPTIDFAEFNIDISDLVQEQLEAKPTIQTSGATARIDSTSESVKWMKYVASYTDAEESIADINGLLIATDGYGYYNEGANPTKPNDNILTNTRNRQVARNGVALMPYVNNTEVTRIDIKSFPSGDLNGFFIMVPLSLTEQFIQYIQVNLNLSSTQDTSFEIRLSPSDEVINYNIIDECKYTPIQVVFKNKYGVFDSLNLFKKQSHSTSTKHDTFVNNYITAGNYDTTRHQYQKLNVTAKDKIKTNSGYILEAENEIYKELLQSETVYFYEDAKLIPVNLTNSSLDFKTQLDDKLFNYSLDFEYAYNVIQNV